MEIRKLIAIKEGRYDTHYTLIRMDDGRIWVETFDSPNQTFRTGSPGPTIMPVDFDKHLIDGRSLRDYVGDALREVAQLQQDQKYTKT